MTARRITNNTSGIVTLPPDLGSLILGPGRGIITAFTEREIVEILGGDAEFPRGLAIRDVPDQPGTNTKAAANDYFPSVLDRDLATPPAAPAKSDRYLVASGGTGAWSGRDNQIAQWAGSMWLFTIPTKGAQTYAEDELKGLVFDGTSWAVSGGGAVSDADMPDPFTPPDGTWNVVGEISASGGATGSEQFGDNALASGTRSTAVGANSQATSTDTVAAGENARANGTQATAYGTDTLATNTQCVAIGRSAQAVLSTDTALGGFAAATGGFSTAVGNNAASSGNGSIAAGQGSVASDADAIAIGPDASATHAQSMALGNDAASTAINRATVGLVGGGVNTRKDLEVSGDLRVSGNELEGQVGLIQSNSVVIASMSGASQTLPNVIPAGATLLGLVGRVITAITGATGFDVGDGADVDRWGANIAIALDTTFDISDWTDGAITAFPSGNDVVLTALGSDFTAGSVRVTAYFFTAIAPTS